MATWDDNLWYGYSAANLGLRTCPFNRSHRVKADNYSKHVLKCEQSLPSGHSTRVSTFSPYLSIQSLVSDVTESLSQLSTSDVSQSTLTLNPRDGCLSPDSAIDCKTNSSSSADNTENEDQCLQRSDRNSCQLMRNGLNAISEREPVVPIVPQTQNSAQNGNNGAVGENIGDGDNDDWDNSNAPHFDLYGGFDGYEELTDEHICDLADGFIDVVLLNRLDKQKRKELYRKLIELRNAGEERRSKAFKQLLSSEGLHNQIRDIPQEIRKPKVDIRDIFKIKTENNRVETLKKPTVINTEPKECSANPWSVDELTALKTEQSPEQPIAKSEASLPMNGDCNVRPELTTSCNNCWSSLTLTEENIKRMTVFCETCSGVKFGGYFECQQCGLYGYFAKNQIEQHLTQHFAK